MAVSKKTRFEVFKRDKFICQYCGKSAPDVVLQVDHIHPVSKGGDDDLLNLVTSCRDCNCGKRDRLLADDTSVKKRKKQLDELQEKREQFEMLMEWHRSLVKLDSEIIGQLTDFFSELIYPGSPFSQMSESQQENFERITNDGCTIDEYLRKWLKRFSANEIMQAMRISRDQYLERGDRGQPTLGSARKVWDYIPKICTTKRKIKDKPYMEDLYYTRGILRNRCYLTKRQEWECLDLMEKHVLNGLPSEVLKDIAKKVTSYHEFEKGLYVNTIELNNFLDGFFTGDAYSFLSIEGNPQYGQKTLQRN